MEGERNQDGQHFLKKLECQESDAGIKTKTLLIESSSANRTFSVQSSVGRIKSVGSGNYDFEYRDKSKTLNIF